MIKTLLSLIPVQQLVKYLPDVLSYLLTKGLGYVFVKYPNKSEKALETAQDISKAMVASIAAAEDKTISKEELAEMKRLWKEVFE